MMKFSFKAFGAGLALAATILSSASAADMIENYNSPATVRTVHRIRHHRVLSTYVRTDRRDCGQLIYEYRTDPDYTEVKTVCSPAWSKPSGSAESGSVTTTSGNATQ